jgi:hypothetical protein
MDTDMQEHVAIDTWMFACKSGTKILCDHPLPRSIRSLVLLIWECLLIVNTVWA